MVAAGAAGLEQWLASVPDLEPKTAQRAGALFSSCGVDAPLLDFLASEEGLRILSAWRSRGGSLLPAAEAAETSATAGAAASEAATAAAAEPADTGGAAAGGRPPQRDEAREAPEQATPSRPSGHALQGRQRIPAADRRLGGHYFAPAPVKPEAHARQVRAKEKTVERPAAEKAELRTGSTRGPFYAAAHDGALASAASMRAASLKSDGPKERLLGTLKSFSDDTGYGFIHCEHVPQDVFLSSAERPQDGRLDPGRLVEFTLAYDSLRRPKARDTVWLAPAAVTACRFVGRIKSVGNDYGFIECSRAHKMYGRDVYFTTGQLHVGEFEPSQLVSFDISINGRGQPQARHLAREDSAFETASDSGSDSGSASPGGSRGWAAKQAPSVTHW